MSVSGFYSAAAFSVGQNGGQGEFGQLSTIHSLHITILLTNQECFFCL